MIKLYHYSNNDFKGYIKPSFFGLNSYTNNSKKISGFKRIFFYLTDNPQEYIFKGSKYLYTALIDKDKIYDIIEDKLKLQDVCLNFTDILTKVKLLGYKGILGTVNSKYNIISLFYDIKIIEKITLHNF